MSAPSGVVSLSDGAKSRPAGKMSHALKLYPVRIEDDAIAVDADAVGRDPPGGSRKVWDFT